MLSRCFLDFSVSVGAFVIGLSQISSFFTYRRKRKRSDSVLWQKPLQPQKNPKKQLDNIKTPPKTSITQRLRTDVNTNYLKLACQTHSNIMPNKLIDFTSYNIRWMQNKCHFLRMFLLRCCTFHWAILNFITSDSWEYLIILNYLSKYQVDYIAKDNCNAGDISMTFIFEFLSIVELVNFFWESTNYDHLRNINHSKPSKVLNMIYLH